MIFASVGTNEARFDRFVRALEPFAGDEEVIVQHGPSSVRVTGATFVDYLPFEELTAHIRRARVVVMHAGAGSVMTALANGVRPVVLPRLRRYGEAVDDHQLPFGRRLHADGLIELVEDPDDLPTAVARHDGHFVGGMGAAESLVGDIRDFIRTRIEHS